MISKPCSVSAFFVGLAAWVRRGFQPLPPDEIAQLPTYAARSVLALISGWAMLLLLFLAMPRLTSVFGRNAWLTLLLSAGVYGGWLCLSGIGRFIRLRCEEGRRILETRTKKRPGYA